MFADVHISSLGYLCSEQIFYKNRCWVLLTLLSGNQKFMSDNCVSNILKLISVCFFSDSKSITRACY